MLFRSNFEMVGATMEVSTHHHPGSDHKGFLYRIRGTPGTASADKPKALPHRLFDLPEVIDFASTRLAGFNASNVPDAECFGAWDVCKTKIKNFAQHTWDAHVRAQGAHLKTIKEGGLSSSVVQYIPTGLLVAGSILACGSPISHEKMC